MNDNMATLIPFVGLICVMAGIWFGLRAAADNAVVRENNEAIVQAMREDNRARAIAAAQAYDEMELGRIFDEYAIGVEASEMETAAQACCGLRHNGDDDAAPVVQF